jgi:hypothetical protein
MQAVVSRRLPIWLRVLTARQDLAAPVGLGWQAGQHLLSLRQPAGSHLTDPKNDLPLLIPSFKISLFQHGPEVFLVLHTLIRISRFRLSAQV